MGAELDRVLTTVALDVFEQLGFLLADPLPIEDEPPMVGMRVAFEGPTRGAAAVWGDDVLRQALTAGMLGFDEEPGPALQADALGEVASVICGNVIPRVHDSTAEYRLHAPESAQAAAAEPEARVTLGFEGGVARVEWYEADP